MLHHVTASHCGGAWVHRIDNSIRLPAVCADKNTAVWRSRTGLPHIIVHHIVHRRNTVDSNGDNRRIRRTHIHRNKNGLYISLNHTTEKDIDIQHPTIRRLTNLPIRKITHDKHNRFCQITNQLTEPKSRTHTLHNSGRHRHIVAIWVLRHLVRLAGMSTILSAPVSYGLSFCVNFILSNYFTFHTRPNAKSIFICGQPSHQSGIADYACRTFCQYSRKYLCTAACNGHMRTCELLSRAFCPHRPPLSRDTGDDGIITVPHPNNTAVTER